METYYGIVFALTALFSWGFGEFYTQRAVRKTGVLITLFYIGLGGCIGLFPLVAHELSVLESGSIYALTTLGIISFFASLFTTHALRLGKISVVEPLAGLELPLTVALSVIIGKEFLTMEQLALIVMISIGIVFTVTLDFRHLHYHKRIFEKGVLLAALGAICMAVTNYLVGISSQQISPLLTIWYIHSLVALAAAVLLIAQGETRNTLKALKRYTPLIGSIVILENFAWISFATATTFIPISIAVTVSEAYIALAAMLGLFYNREKIKRHQMWGILIAIVGIIALAFAVTAG
ncbi:MAG TPA: EamA family transporter [Candidatus Paceibacterota bacterium]|nr:EamA family transporter [Candidatus Paceibacterota bacterium]